jgi:two-component system, cell cycle sensor histidine kinase and response regulator CckA
MMESESSPGSGKRLLIVDDDKALLLLLTRMVERQGFQAVTASTAAEALDAYRQDGSCFDMVITDLVMSGTDGPTFAKELMEINPAVKILVSTGLNNSADMAALVELGVKGFVFKPYNSSDLAQKIQDTLNS